jgi:hypothetical protein
LIDFDEFLVFAKITKMGIEQGQVTIGRLPEKADVVIPVATGISLFLWFSVFLNL